MEKNDLVNTLGPDGTPFQGHASPVSSYRETTIPPARFWILAVGVCLGLFLSMIDTSIVATSIYNIGIEFSDVRRVNWVALAYTLAYLGCAVTIARISDVIGRRNTFVAAYVIFLAFSIGCGFSRSLNQLIAFRALQGIGGSGLLTLSMVMLPELCPPALRQHLGSIIGLVIAGSGVLGPVLGGILTHYATWRWVFWINGPIGLVSLVIFSLSWPKAEYLPTSSRRSWKDFDFVGSLLIIAAAILVVFAFQNAGEASNPVWSSAIFIAPLIVGLGLWTCLIAWGYASTRVLNPNIALTFPVGLFRNRLYAAAAISTLFLGYPYFITIFSCPLRAQIVEEKSPLLAGVLLLPMLASTALGTVMAGGINKRKSYLFETVLAGACLMTLGFGLLTLIRNTSDNSKALGFTVFAGLGYGLSTSGATMMTLLETPIADTAPAQGIVSQLRILGGSLGISTSTVFLNSKAREILSSVLTPEEQATLGHGSVSLSEARRHAVHQAYSEAFRDGMIASAAVAGVATLIVMSACSRGPRPNIDELQARRVQEETARIAGQLEASQNVGST